MTVYIKREYAVDAVLDVYYNTPNIDLSGEKFESAILKIQAADVAPVQHGRWIDCEEDPNEKYCSVCNHERNACNSWWNYCPNCGCRMDLEG